jgi:hypothetical protein
MTTEELKTNGYAIKFDPETGDKDRLKKVLLEIYQCPSVANPGVCNFYWLRDGCAWTSSDSTDRQTIPLSEVQLMSEVLPLPRMVEVKNPSDVRWYERRLLYVADCKYRRRYVTETDDGESTHTFMFMREINPNKETNESIARLEAELETLKSTLK